MEDVTKLTDEELDKRLNGEEEVAEPTEAQPSEEEPTEEPEDQETQEEPEEEQPEQGSEPQEEEPKEEQPKEEEPKPPSRREQHRIQHILAKRADAQAPLQQQQENLDYSKELDADPEVIERLNKDRQASQQQGYNQGFEQAKAIQFHTRLEVDAPKVEAKYDFLDKNSANFDPVRADAINSLYLNQVGYDAGDPSRGRSESVANPNIRYAEFVEAQMEFAEALMADRQAQTVKNVTKQAAQTGLRPDGSAAKALNLNKQPGDMTDEELDMYLKKAGWASNKR